MIATAKPMIVSLLVIRVALISCDDHVSCTRSSTAIGDGITYSGGSKIQTPMPHSSIVTPREMQV